MADTILKPGQETQIAGQYVEIDGDGVVQNDGAEVTLAGGDTAPPTEQPKRRWLLVDASRRAAKGPYTGEATDEKREGIAGQADGEIHEVSLGTPRYTCTVLKSTRQIKK